MLSTSPLMISPYPVSTSKFFLVQMKRTAALHFGIASAAVQRQIKIKEAT